MPECRKKYCTEHFDTTGCFLVISLDKKTEKKNTLQFCPPPPSQQKQDEYILMFSRSVSLKEHLPEQEVRRSHPFVETIKLLRRLKTTLSALFGAPTQVRKVWSRMVTISGLWKDDLLQKCEMKYIQLPVDTLGSLQTPNFL